ncbi:MAG: phosphatase PAP2 family protein [Pseudonocardia sediminis]
MRIRRLDGWLDPVNDVDQAISRAVSRHPRSRVDDVMKVLSGAANHSVLWFAIAAVLASRKGASRKAALRGVLAVAGASATANGIAKPLLPRRRPAASELPAYQVLAHPPTSSSFPSGHAASAAAFATAVCLESPRLGLVVAPVAATVAYSRVHVGVHWASDVLVGFGLGTGIALATRRWWPVRASDEARARPIDSVPPLPGGEGMLVVANSRSGPAGTDPSEDVAAALPLARLVPVREGEDLADALDAEIARSDGWVKAIGVAGGDGTVVSAASVAVRHGLPLMVVPAGTLNHFARDVGIYDLQEAVDASAAGEAVAAGLAEVVAHPVGDPTGDAVIRRHHFLNTASIGSYPELVRLREKLQPRWGKWPAFAAALVTVLRRSEKVHVKINGEWEYVWFLFVGNGPYHPRGMVPAFRPTLDSGLLDVRWVRADLRFSRLRVIVSLLLGALGHSRVYQQAEMTRLDVELVQPSVLATDGEVVEEAGRYTFGVSPHPVPVYRRDERNWSDRERPFLG